MKKNIINLLVTISIVLSLSSCNSLIYPTNTEAEVSFNKFKKSTKVSNTENYVHQTTGCDLLSFSLFYHIDEDLPANRNVADFLSKLCWIAITTKSSSPTKIKKGCHLWIYIDGKKVDFSCDYYTGKKETSVNSVPATCDPSTGTVTGGGVYTTTTCYEGATFYITLDTMKEIANAEAVSFEVENYSGSEIKGTFSDKNFQAVKDFVEKVESLREHALLQNN